MELTPEQALQKGVEAHKAGNVEEADRYYTAILKANPNHPDANHNMGVLGVGLGKVQEALPFFKTALASNPSIVQYWLSYIDALLKLDRINDAKVVFDQANSHGIKGGEFDKLHKRLKEGNIIENYMPQVEDLPNERLQALLSLYRQGKMHQVFNEAQKLTKQYPKSLAVWNLLGTSAAQSGQADSALFAFQEAISINPHNPEPHYNLGIILQDQNKPDEAIGAYSKALSIKPDYAEAHNNMGVALKDQGMLDNAIEAYSTALSIKPDYAEAYNNIGFVLQDQGKLNEALEAYYKALSIKPDYAEAQNNIGVCLKDLGKLDEAIEAYRKAISIKPDSAQAYNNIGISFQDQGKLNEALEAYSKALSLKPDYAEAQNNIGVCHKNLGELDEAIEAYSKALSIKPDYAEAHRNLSIIKKYDSGEPQFIKVKSLIGSIDITDEAKCSLSFALAKMYEDMGNLDQAFKYLSQGNKTRKKLLNYSIKKDEKLFSDLKRAQKNLIKNSFKRQSTLSDTIPIFIVGMPRSGTTLVEQIVSSHSKVNGAGELIYISHFGYSLASEMKIADKDVLINFREKYLLELLKVSNGKQYVTDKMPQNFRFIPLICAALPEAKIIHVQRNAVATCWSNYRQYFSSNGLGYCYDLTDVTEYYYLYKDLMKLWQSYYGDRLYNLNYESLTTDQENQTRKLIKNLELNWEDACLSPHKNKRSVRTASQQQVRQRVYQGSSDAWKKYEPFLDGVFDSLPSL